MYLVVFIFLICVVDSIKGFSRCRGYWSILLSICWYICSAGYVELPIVLLYLLRCSVISTLMLGVSHAVEVLVLGLLLVVYKIHYRNRNFNTAVVVACHIYSLMVSPDFVDIGSEYFVVYLSCVYMFGWLCRATCSFVSASMLGISHAVQNDKKL